MRALAVGALVVVVSACGGEERARQQVAVERAAQAEAVTQSQRAALAPSTGRWTEEHLLDRLVRAGVAPRKAPDQPAGPEWMKSPPLKVLAGGGEVHAWIFADSTARRAVTDSLDAVTGTPAGRTVPFAAPLRFVVQNNLAAFISGGTETNQERIALALEAGLPVSGPPRQP